MSSQQRLQLTLNHLRSLSLTYSKDEAYTSAPVGSKYLASWRNFCVNSAQNAVVSYFHDVPLDLDLKTREATMVVEVPRWSNAKFEINTKIPGNPILQDIKKDAVRFVRNLFPYHGYIHNYGAFPQTWEDPTEKSNIDGLYGDGDPLDVCEIGATVLPTGAVKRVRILGSLALVDDGELDWKVIVVNVEDDLARHVRDIQDVFDTCPGLLEATRSWFKNYKKPDGKPENVLALNGEFMGAEDTIRTIQECHEAWRKLVSGQTVATGFAVDNVTIKDSPGYTSKFGFSDSVMSALGEPDAEIPVDILRSHYFKAD